MAACDAERARPAPLTLLHAPKHGDTGLLAPASAPASAPAALPCCVGAGGLEQLLELAVPLLGLVSGQAAGALVLLLLAPPRHRGHEPALQCSVRGCTAAVLHCMRARAVARAASWAAQPAGSRSTWGVRMPRHQPCGSMAAVHWACRRGTWRGCCSWRGSRARPPMRPPPTLVVAPRPPAWPAPRPEGPGWSAMAPQWREKTAISPSLRAPHPRPHHSHPCVPLRDGLPARRPRDECGRAAGSCGGGAGHGHHRAGVPRGAAAEVGAAVPPASGPAASGPVVAAAAAHAQPEHCRPAGRARGCMRTEAHARPELAA